MERREEQDCIFVTNIFDGIASLARNLFATIYILAEGAPPPCIPRQGKIAQMARFPLNPFSL